MPDELAAVGQAGERIGVGELVLPFKAAGALDRGSRRLGGDVPHAGMVPGPHPVAPRKDPPAAPVLRASPRPPAPSPIWIVIPASLSQYFPSTATATSSVVSGDSR